jgi:hypothetical protein
MEYNMLEASKPPRPRLMRVPEACTYIKVGPTKFYDLVKRGLIEVKKMDGATRVVTESLDRYVDNLPSNINHADHPAFAPLDAKFFGTVRKVRDGTVVPDDQWMGFLLKDNAFAEVLPIYRRICERMGADVEQLAAVDRAIARVQAWRKAHPSELKVPDAKGERLFDMPGTMQGRAGHTNEGTE